MLALDGYRLGASLFHPAGDARRVALMVPATGVPQRLYTAYARFLAQRGIATLTWDWRGIGRSRPGRLRGFHATMRDWATLDLGGALSHVARHFPQLPVTAVAHSFGAQAIGLSSGSERLHALVTVAGPSGYWGHFGRPEKYGYAALWYVGMPVLSRVLGYFPSRMFRFGEDLPRGVALEWARWCRSPEYLGTWEGHARFSAPLLALSFTDDRYAPPASTDALHDRYVRAPQTRRYIDPVEIGAQRIGHFGFFREGLVPALWHDTAEWLLRS
jgi:predicted alpha/beta hydrolase